MLGRTATPPDRAGSCILERDPSKSEPREHVKYLASFHADRRSHELLIRKMNGVYRHFCFRFKD